MDGEGKEPFFSQRDIGMLLVFVGVPNDGVLVSQAISHRWSTFSEDSAHMNFAGIWSMKKEKSWMIGQGKQPDRKKLKSFASIEKFDNPKRSSCSHPC